MRTIVLILAALLLTVGFATPIEASPPSCDPDTHQCDPPAHPPTRCPPGPDPTKWKAFVLWVVECSTP